MKRLIIALLALGMLAFVGACGAGNILPAQVKTQHDDTKAENNPDPWGPDQVDGQQPTEEPDDPTNKRGNIEFAIGDEMGLTNPSGDTIAWITVTDLEFITCQNMMGETANPLLMEFTIETSEDALRSDLGSVFNPFAMSLYDASTGVTSKHQMSVPVCMQKANELHVPVSLSPGSKYTGGILFSEAPDSGAVIYTPAWSTNGAEWHY